MPNWAEHLLKIVAELGQPLLVSMAFVNGVLLWLNVNGPDMLGTGLFVRQYWPYLWVSFLVLATFTLLTSKTVDRFASEPLGQYLRRRKLKARLANLVGEERNIMADFVRNSRLAIKGLAGSGYQAQESLLQDTLLSRIDRGGGVVYYLVEPWMYEYLKANPELVGIKPPQPVSTTATSSNT